MFKALFAIFLIATYSGFADITPGTTGSALLSEQSDKVNNCPRLILPKEIGLGFTTYRGEIEWFASRTSTPSVTAVKMNPNLTVFATGQSLVAFTPQWGPVAEWRETILAQSESQDRVYIVPRNQNPLLRILPRASGIDSLIVLNKGDFTGSQVLTWFGSGKTVQLTELVKGDWTDAVMPRPFSFSELATSEFNDPVVHAGFVREGRRHPGRAAQIAVVTSEGSLYLSTSQEWANTGAPRFPKLSILGEKRDLMFPVSEVRNLMTGEVRDGSRKYYSNSVTSALIGRAKDPYLAAATDIFGSLYIAGRDGAVVSSISEVPKSAFDGSPYLSAAIVTDPESGNVAAYFLNSRNTYHLKVVLWDAKTSSFSSWQMPLHAPNHPAAIHDLNMLRPSLHAASDGLSAFLGGAYYGGSEILPFPGATRQAGVLVPNLLDVDSGAVFVQDRPNSVQILPAAAVSPSN